MPPSAPGEPNDGAIRVYMRHYFSYSHLQAAKRAARRAEAVEQQGDRVQQDELDHRADVITAIVSAALYLEAAVNEVFQDASDELAHPPHSLRGVRVTADRVALLRAFWAATSDGQKVRTLAKYQLLVHAMGGLPLDEAGITWQRAQTVIVLRDYLVHYRPESVSRAVEHRFTRRLAGYRITDNPLAGEGHPWWPERALGSALGHWCVDAATTFVGDVSSRTGLLKQTPIRSASRAPLM